MATAQTAVSSGTTPGSGPQGAASGPSAAPGDRKLYEDARDSPRSRSGMADAGSQGSGSIKRRLEERDEGIRYGSISSPSHHSPQPRASSARIPPHEDVRASPGSRLGRNGGHPAYSSPYDEDAKRRRVEERYQPPPPGTGAVGDYEYGGEEHEDMRYMRAPRPSNGRYSPAEGPPPLPHPSSSEQRRPSLMDGEYDAGVPLARRRGDAAQAKASRLHIDTGSAAAGDAPPSRQSSTYQPSPGRATTVAKSAPPQKMTFSDRGGDAPPFDPRGEPPPPRYHPAPAHGGYSRQPGPPPGHFVDERGGYISPPLRGPPPPGAHSQGHPPPPPPQAHHHQQGPPPQAGPAPPPPSARPVHQGAPTSARAFVPQTATLPSPAYHTTHFMRGGGPPGIPQNHSVPPRTAGLNPPPTARLPEHLRSPPSSKTQFLSLFANFYDSLSDSRTLKATLEDQVRRSNTLLQTLQRSSRVLELSVDRRLKEERDVWEARVHDLEGRCRELERRLGVPRPDEDDADRRRGRRAEEERDVRVDAEEERKALDENRDLGDDEEADVQAQDGGMIDEEQSETRRRGRGRADPRRGATADGRILREEDDDEDESRERRKMRRSDGEEDDDDDDEQARENQSQVQSGSAEEEEDEVVDDAMQD